MTSSRQTDRSVTKVRALLSVMSPGMPSLRDFLFGRHGKATKLYAGFRKTSEQIREKQMGERLRHKDLDHSSSP